jgi:hypothetical protein
MAAGTGNGGAVSGTGGAVSGTGGAAGGNNMKCGNGQVDPGEDCEGGNLNGRTCMSLGFDSGTLACSSGCSYDTSGCVGALTPVIKASRTSCAAPCAVFFDATGTTGLTGGDYVGGSFNWSFDATNVDPTAGHRQAIGFVAAHVFQIPGTYQVTVLARDLAGHAGSASASITVSAMTGQTYYVASNGSDSNAGTSMSKPFATYATAIKKAGAQTSILFRRGDTFAVGSSTLTLSGTGPYLVGAYTDPAASSTAAPILNSTLAAANTNLMDVQSTDLRVADLHIISAGAGNGIAVNGSPNTLFERVEVESNPSVPMGAMLASDTASAGTFFVDCNIHGFTGTGYYGSNTVQLAIIGTTISFGGAEHGIRDQGGTSTFISGNNIVGTSASFDGIAIRGDNQDAVVVNNRSNREIGLTPQNTSAVEHITNALVEGNLIADDRTMNMSESGITVTAQHIYVRNNIIVNAPIAFSVQGESQLPTNYVDQIFIYNNTTYFFPVSYPAGYSSNLLICTGTGGAVALKNNIFAHNLTANDQSTAFLSGGCAGVTEDHNLGFGPNVKGTWTPGKGAGDIVGNPMFVSTDPTQPNAFQLGAGSPAADVGAALPVYQDYAGAPRPAGAGIDIGAFELQ